MIWGDRRGDWKKRETRGKTAQKLHRFFSEGETADRPLLGMDGVSFHRSGDRRRAESGYSILGDRLGSPGGGRQSTDVSAILTRSAKQKQKQKPPVVYFFG